MGTIDYDKRHENGRWILDVGMYKVRVKKVFEQLSLIKAEYYDINSD